MGSLKLLLGMIPSTFKIEQAEKALIIEFEKLNAFAGSDQLAKYYKLNELVNSSDFIRKKKDIESLKYRNSEEFANEKEFLSLQKSNDIVLYFKTISRNELKRFKDLDGSEKINEFEKLQEFVRSPEFREKQKMKPFTFRDTEEYQRFLEYKDLKADPEIRAFLRSKKKRLFSKFRRKKEIEITKTILAYQELDRYIKSSEFLDKKNMKPLTFKDSEEYKKLLEY